MRAQGSRRASLDVGSVGEVVGWFELEGGLASQAPVNGQLDEMWQLQMEGCRGGCGLACTVCGVRTASLVEDDKWFLSELQRFRLARCWVKRAAAHPQQHCRTQLSGAAALCHLRLGESSRAKFPPSPCRTGVSCPCPLPLTSRPHFSRQAHNNQGQTTECRRQDAKEPWPSTPGSSHSLSGSRDTAGKQGRLHWALMQAHILRILLVPIGRRVNEGAN